MISRIKIVEEGELTQESKKLDWMLTQIDSEWKSAILYTWCWGAGQGGEDINPSEIYNLNDFSHGYEGFDDGVRLSIYGKRPQFLLEEDNTNRKEVLTNIEPLTNDLFLYSPKTEIREVNINELFKI